MPADDGLHRMSPADLAAFLRDLRALRVREGLRLDGLNAQAELPPDTEAAGQPGFTITRLGPRPGPRPGPRHDPRRAGWRPSPGLIGVTAVGVVLAGLAAGGALLSMPTGHSETSAPSAPLPGGGRSMAGRGGRMQMRIPPPAVTRPKPAPPSPKRARTARKTRVRVVVPVLVRPARMGAELAGVGCPASPYASVSVAAAASGPGWTSAGGGWTGNGCDGSSVWTMDPAGNQASPSTLTWFFYPSLQASACQLAVFVPTQNAAGQGTYQISAGPASLGTVSVDQAASAGQWVTLGSFPAAGGMLTVQLLPGTATLAAASGGAGQAGNGGGDGGTGKGGKKHSGPGAGQPTPAPSPAPGHNAAVAASAARASCH
jgi:hypothetical protein